MQIKKVVSIRAGPATKSYAVTKLQNKLRAMQLVLRIFLCYFSLINNFKS